MNKKVIAAAVAGALGAIAAPAAVAQTSTVQIGGSLTVFYYMHDPNNGTPSSAMTFSVSTITVGGVTTSSTVVVPAVNGGHRTDILESSEPELFVRGEEQLGGGLSVWFQCTSSMDGMITGGNANGICGRNSGVGFKGSFGNIFVGNWDTPHKLVFNRARGWFGGTNSLTGGSARILQTLGGGAPSGVGNGGATGASFFRRQAAAWNYHSPSWSGFSINAAFSAANEATGIPEGAGISKPRLWSIGVNYDNGPLYIGGSYEQHKDYNPLTQILGFSFPVAGVSPTTIQTNLLTGAVTSIISGGNACNTTWTTTAGLPCYTGGNDHNWMLVAGYTFAGVFSIRGIYTQSKYELLPGLELDHKGWGLFADWTIGGPHTLRAQYVRADDFDLSGAAVVAAAGAGGTVVPVGLGDSGADLWSIFYSYAFSKRTEGSIGYTRMSNDGLSDVYGLGKVGASMGGSQSSAGIVLRHRF